MTSRTIAARRLVGAACAGALLFAAACVHAPASQVSARAPLASAPEQASVRPERRDRVLVTGSRIPRPVGRDGLPVAEFPVRIYWYDQLGQKGSGDLARMLRTTDPAVQ